MSADPFYPATVENLVKIGVTFPIVLKTLAFVYLVTSCVTLKKAWAAPPFACTTLWDSLTIKMC